MVAKLSKLPNKAYPNIPTVTEDSEAHTAALHAIKEALETHERRTGDFLNSFIRFGELVDLGIINVEGDLDLTFTDTTDHLLLSNIGVNTHIQIDTHLALVNEHLDWVADQGATNIDRDNLQVFTSALRGDVPASGGGTTNFLRADGSWAAPAGGASALPDLSDVTSAAVTNRFILIADGGAYVGRAFLEADISDFGSYTEADVAEDITGGWTFSTVKTVFSEDIDLEDGKKIHIEGTTAAEFAEIGVVSSNNTLLFSQTGLSSGGLHGAWFQMPVRVRDGHQLGVYNSNNADSVIFAHNGTDLNASTTGTRHFSFLSLTGRVRDNGFDLMQTRTSTTVLLELVGNAINTSDDKIAGYMIFNTTTGAPVWAVGPNANSVWVDATGTTAHTPIA